MRFPLVILCAVGIVESVQLSTTFVWTDQEIDIETVSSEISLEGYGELSFIQLAHAGSRLSITAVQKSNRLSRHVRFCSTALPAAIVTFLQIHSLSLDHLTSIGVLNAAYPPEAGCRCYVRTMISMGFDIVNGELLSQSQVAGFCEDATLDYIDAVADTTAGELQTPPITSEGQTWISTALVHSTRS